MLHGSSATLGAGTDARHVRVSPSQPTTTTNPGAECAKEVVIVCLVRPPFRPGNGARLGGVSTLESKTTLGNGYLGSRIDEERSEMRYLV